jgi:hypothetical protein
MADARLVVVYQNDSGPGPVRVKFKRHDTLAAVSCVDCATFTDEGTCLMGYANPWPLGRVCCSQWSLRTTPHAMKTCRGCDKKIPRYVTNYDWCGEKCRMLARIREGLSP